MINSITDLFDRYEVHTVEHLSREVYEATREGVSVELIEGGDGVKLSTIVEGTDAEWSSVLRFPFDADELEGAFLESEAWADEIRDQDVETYDLTVTDLEVLQKAVEAFAETGHYNTYAVEIEHLLVMLESVTSGTLTYHGPEGN